jgi:hypothetical protein
VTARPEAAQALHDLARESPVALRVRGNCMEPALAPGELIAVRAARFYWPGDIVAFAAAGGGLTVHRVIGWRPAVWTRPWAGWLVWTQADDAALPDAPVPPARLVGRVGASPRLRARTAAAVRLVRHLAYRAASRLGLGERSA